MRTLCMILVSTVLTAMVFTTNIALAQEGGNENSDLSMEDLEALLSGEAEVKAYKFPRIEPELELSAGYRWVSNSGPSSVGRYEFLEDSVVLGAEARAFKYPHRFYLKANFLNEKDYFGDLRYAYGERLFFRWLGRSLFHDTENITLLDLGADGTSPDVARRDVGASYGLKAPLEDIFLRIKPFHFPTHVFGRVWLHERKGTVQDTSLLGSGWFNDLVRTSQSTSLDHDTAIYDAGLNSHLGPMEAEYVHRWRDFDPGSNTLLDDYEANTFRPAGTYPHGRVPEFMGSSDILKLHTSYTGRLVASATASVKERENETGGAKADYFTGAGAITFMPVTELTFFLRYRHDDMDVDNPSTASITDTSGITSGPFVVKPSIERSTDKVSFTARYRPVRGLTLKGKYGFENIDRDNAAAWGISSSTRKNTFKLSADTRPLRSLGLKAELAYTDVEDPAYNTQPDRLRGGSVSLSWSPAARVSTILSYEVLAEDRDGLDYGVSSSASDMEALSEKLFGSGTVMVSENVSVTLGYAYLYNEIKQDLVYEDLSGTAVAAPGAINRDTAHSASLQVDHMATSKLDVGAGVTYTRSRGKFVTNNQDLVEPVSVSSLVDFEMDETVVSFSGDYRFWRGFGLGLGYHYIKREDKLDNPHDDIERGNVQIVMVRVSKKW